jgi:putative redox protein
MASVKGKLVAGTTYQVETSAGTFTLTSDQPTTVGGTGKGPNPKEFLMAALVSCTIQTLKMVAAGRKWDLQEVAVEVTHSEVPDPKNPGAKVSQFDTHIEVKGNLSPAELKAIEQTAGKCPVAKWIAGSQLVTKQVTKV